jgi:hypothetical protein
VPKFKERRPDKKADQIDPRAIRRTFKWRYGHDPNDDDARPDSGWVYINWEISEGPPTQPRQAQQLPGGPEAFPCDRCGAMTRIVARKQPTEIIENSDVIRLGEKVDPQKVNSDVVYLVACPGCNQKTQFPGNILRQLVYRKTGRLIQ